MEANKIWVERVWQKESAFEFALFVYYQRGSFSWVTHEFRCLFPMVCK